MLHNSEPSQVAFDEVMRHLLNVTWWDEPRIVEECLAYTNAAMARWPDATRTLHVTSQEVMFLDHVFQWGPLLRGIDLRRVPSFLPTFTAALEQGDLFSLRYIALDIAEIDHETFELIGKHVDALEGFAITCGTFNADRTYYEFEPEFFIDELLPAASELKWLIVREQSSFGDIFDTSSVYASLRYLEAPLLERDARFLDERILPNLQTLCISPEFSDSSDILTLIEEAPFETLTLVGVEGFHSWSRRRIEEAALARGWNIDESARRFSHVWHLPPN